MTFGPLANEELLPKIGGWPKWRKGVLIPKIIRKGVTRNWVVKNIGWKTIFR